MIKIINKDDLKEIVEIDEKNFNKFLKKLFTLYPEGIDMSELSDVERQRFKAKEWSYSVCGDIKFNAANLICVRCQSKKVAQLVYGDVFMRMCNGNKQQRTKEMERFRRMGLFINPSPTKDKNSKDYICLDCGNEW